MAPNEYSENEMYWAFFCGLETHYKHSIWASMCSLKFVVSMYIVAMNTINIDSLYMSIISLNFVVLMIKIVLDIVTTRCIRALKKIQIYTYNIQSSVIKDIYNIGITTKMS